MSDKEILEALENAAEVVDALRLAKLPTDDLGMAERFRLRFGQLVRKTPDGGWLAFDPTIGIWVGGSRGEALVRQYAHSTARLLWHEHAAAKRALEASDSVKPHIGAEVPAALLRAINYYGSASGTIGMLRQAEPYLGAELKDIDPDPHLICVLNGTLRPTFINEPCLVAYSEDGAPTAHIRVSSLRLNAPPSTVGDWLVRNLGDGIFEVGMPNSEKTETIDVNALKWPVGQNGGFVRNGRTLTHRLYHLHVELLRHDPRHMISRQAQAIWDPTAKCPLFRDHIATVLPDREARDFFQQAMGCGLVGSSEAQAFLFLQGRGADGKSTTMRTIQQVGGTYHYTSDAKTWLDGKNRSAADASPDLADLAGDNRLVYSEEPSSGSRLNESLLKQVTGGIPLRARHLHKSPFSFDPKFLVVMAFNDLPRIDGGDDGLWRRVRLVLFTRQFSRAEQIAAGDVVGKLLTERSGILNWMLEGLAAYHRFRLTPYKGMEEEIAAWRSMADSFGDWLRSRCDRVLSARERTADLYTDYKSFVEQSGGYVLTERRFQHRLTSEQFLSVKGDSGNRFRQGIRLKPAARADE